MGGNTRSVGDLQRLNPTSKKLREMRHYSGDIERRSEGTPKLEQHFPRSEGSAYDVPRMRYRYY